MTELLQLPVPGCTVYRHISEMLTYRTVGYGGHERHFCLDTGATAQCELFQLRRLEIILLTVFAQIFIPPVVHFSGPGIVCYYSLDVSTSSLGGGMRSTEWSLV